MPHGAVRTQGGEIFLDATRLIWSIVASGFVCEVLTRVLLSMESTRSYLDNHVYVYLAAWRSTVEAASTGLNIISDEDDIGETMSNECGFVSFI